MSRCLLTLATGALCIFWMRECKKLTHNSKLTCPPNYTTEYTSSGHKFCLRVLPECERKE